MSQIVPNGILVFFPSYSVMDKCYSIWATSHDGEIMDELTKLKTLCKESQNRDLFASNYTAFLKMYKRKGAIFMGVAGGKLAEGIDFSDEMARMVILVGVPFGNKNDVKMKAKEAYLDEKFQKMSTSNTSKKKNSEVLTAKDVVFSSEV